MENTFEYKCNLVIVQMHFSVRWYQILARVQFKNK